MNNRSPWPGSFSSCFARPSWLRPSDLPFREGTIRRTDVSASLCKPSVVETVAGESEYGRQLEVEST